MGLYTDPPLETDPETLAQDAFAYLAGQFPAWQPSEAQLEVWLLRAFARMAAEARDIASDVPRAIFRFFGQLVGVPSIEDTPASADTTWVLADNAGHVIEEGTVVGIPHPDGDLVDFEVLADVTVPAGQTTTAAGAVKLVAIEAGARGSGLTGTPELVDGLEFEVTSITLVGQTTGGVDAESDDDYLDRLVEQLELMAPRPIIPEDFATFARSVAGIDRALAIDGYNASTTATGQEKTITVAVVDAAGATPSSGLRNEVDALLQAEREWNFLVFVIGPTYTPVQVTFTAKAYAGHVPADVEAAAEAAVAAYLSPANWARPQDSNERLWLPGHDRIRIGELYTVLNEVPGLDYVTALTFGAEGGALGAADFVLAGPAPMPQPGTITGTVSA